MVVEVDLWHAGGGGLSSAHAHALLTRVPASLPLHNRHLLSSTFVGVARQAQWFDEQVGERPSRCRTIGYGASRRRLRIRPASGGSNNTEVFAAFARVHALEGEGGGGRRRRREVAARAADGLDAGRGRRAGSTVGEAAAGGALGVMDARRSEGDFGLAARPAGARTGRRGEAEACGLSACMVSIYDSRDWCEAF